MWAGTMQPAATSIPGFKDRAACELGYTQLAGITEKTVHRCVAQEVAK